MSTLNTAAIDRTVYGFVVNVFVADFSRGYYPMQNVGVQKVEWVDHTLKWLISAYRVKEIRLPAQ